MSTVCDAVTDLIPLYKDKSASAGTRTFVEEHIKSCPDCRRYYKEYSRLVKAHRAADNITVTVDGTKDFAALAKRIRKRRNTVHLATIFFLSGVAFAAVKIAQSAHRDRAAEE